MATVQEKAMCVLWFFETKSVITTQRRFRTTYKKDPPSDNSIRRWLTQLQETGSVLHRKGAGRPSTSQENVDLIQETFTRSPRKSTRQAAVQLHMPHTTIRNVLHSRLHLNAYKCLGGKSNFVSMCYEPRRAAMCKFINLFNIINKIL
ncbi:hypothetical protein AVEN_233114-1 [Araneus ventricosus]|uniref:DUF4817 domain-containing protein n=1 Tax=Araneus ventricosus TaxID=182803 RepID=A0A4Y2MWD7_ARAVE|nr:hypothetical protein AVEN_233114-1 [Araneus ventricosus]